MSINNQYNSLQMCPQANPQLKLSFPVTQICVTLTVKPTGTADQAVSGCALCGPCYWIELGYTSPDYVLYQGGETLFSPLPIRDANHQIPIGMGWLGTGARSRSSPWAGHQEDLWFLGVPVCWRCLQHESKIIVHGAEIIWRATAYCCYGQGFESTAIIFIVLQRNFLRACCL